MTAPPPYRVPGPASLPVTRVELSIACEDLLDRDIMSKSDPVCVLFIKSQQGWYEADRTERIMDSVSPSWTKKFVMDYKFEERQMLRFAVYDIDSNSSSLSEHENLWINYLSLSTLSTLERRREKLQARKLECFTPRLGVVALSVIPRWIIWMSCRGIRTTKEHKRRLFMG